MLHPTVLQCLYSGVSRGHTDNPLQCVLNVPKLQGRQSSYVTGEQRQS